MEITVAVAGATCVWSWAGWTMVPMSEAR